MGDKMDIYERRVIRRKKPLIAETLGFSIEDQKKYLAKGLLTDRQIGSIMIESTEFGQMFRFIDHLMQAENSYDMILSWLQEAEKAWVAEEIRAEVAAEKAELIVEQYVYREAGVLVHRQFGKSVVIPEVDKKEFQLMLATRYQTAKEAWQEQYRRSQEEGEELRQWKEGMSDKLKNIGEKIETFLWIQQKHINGVAHDVHVAPEQTRPRSAPNPSRDYLQYVDDKVEELMQVVGRLAFEKETMTDERKRCLQVLNTERPPLQLDVVLNHALHSAAEDTVKAQRESVLSDKQAQALDAHMRQLRIDTDLELAAKNRQITQLTSIGHDRTRKIQQLEQNLIETREHLDEARGEIDRLNRRCVMIEKTRRIGFYNSGWYDRIYALEHMDYFRSLDTPPFTPRALTRSKSLKDLRPVKSVQKRPLVTRKSYAMIEAKVDTGNPRRGGGANSHSTTKAITAR